MAKITGQIPEQNFEKIRDRIGLILSTELAAQTVASDIKKVWIERSIPFDKTELPAINVVWDNASYDSHNPKDRRGENQYFIDIQYEFTHTSTEKGDIAGSKKAQRIAGIIAYILSSGEYYTLDYDPGLIQSRWIADLKIGRISEGDALHNVVARVSFKVVANEEVGNLSGVAGKIFTSQFKINESEKGFYLEIDNS